jgi:hypothetical protein
MVQDHRAVIVLDIHVWERERAAAVLEQIVRNLSGMVTNDQGGHLVHHRVAKVSLETRYTEVKA